MRRGLIAVAVMVGCQTATTRPGFAPVPDASSTQLRLAVAPITEMLAARLRADSIPLRIAEPRDGYIESEWINAPGWEVVQGRPMGPAMDKVRIWIDPLEVPLQPGGPARSRVTVEIVYRYLADPSRDPREFERHVHAGHVTNLKVRAALRPLVERYGDLAAFEADTTDG